MTMHAATGLRERKKERTHNDLLAAGLRLFEERGFNDVTVDDIAAEVDVSLRTFYRYFSSKEDLLLGDMDESLDVLRSAFAAQPADVPVMTAIRATLLEVTRSLEPMAKDKMARARIVEATPSLLLRRAERLTAWEQEFVPQVASRLGDPVDAPGLRAQLIAAASLAAIRVAYQVWRQDPDGRPWSELSVEALDAMAKGFDNA